MKYGVVATGRCPQVVWNGGHQGQVLCWSCGQFGPLLSVPWPKPFLRSKGEASAHVKGALPHLWKGFTAALLAGMASGLLSTLSPSPPAPILSPQLTERVRAALARCLSPPIRAASHLEEEPWSQSRGGLGENATTILTLRGGGFEEIKALTQTPPLYLLGTDLRPKEGCASPLEGGVELLGQGCESFVSFFLFSRCKWLVAKEGVRRVLE